MVGGCTSVEEKEEENQRVGCIFETAGKTAEHTGYESGGDHAINSNFSYNEPYLNLLVHKPQSNARSPKMKPNEDGRAAAHIEKVIESTDFIRQAQSKENQAHNTSGVSVLGPNPNVPEWSWKWA